MARSFALQYSIESLSGLNRRLNKGPDTRRMGDLHTIIKGKEGIAGQYRTIQAEVELFRLSDRLAERIDAGCLSAALPISCLFLTNAMALLFKCFTYKVGKNQVCAR